MNNKTTILIIVVIAIIIGIVLLQNQNPKLEDFNEIPIESINTDQLNLTDSLEIQKKEGKYNYARELQNPQRYINIDNITISELIGKKVILVDFWTYSCINCQRTLPYLNAWYNKYSEDGLEIIGVHTPEFEFEKDYDNVLSAVEKYEVKYPVVQDNNYETWRAYNNHYWPRKYLIDIDGFIVYDHIGEGKYYETEKEIQKALEERNKRLNMNNSISIDLVNPDTYSPEYGQIRTPEIYFGYGFSRNQFGNSVGWNPENSENYKLPNEIKEDMFYLEGEWFNHKDYMLSLTDSKILLNYKAGQINLVAGSDSPIQVNVSIDGEYVSSINISEYDLYSLYYDNSYSEHTIKIDAPSGLKAYTFTFG